MEPDVYYRGQPLEFSSQHIS